MKRLFIILTVIILALLPVIPALAVTYSIDSIEAYRHVVEPDDQLYLIKYTDSAITDNLTFTLYSSNATALGSTVPYIYYTTGLAVIYFSAATAPIWLDSCSVNMSGLYTSITSSIFTSWSTSSAMYQTSIDLTKRIQYLAQHLSVTGLTQTDSGGSITLSTSGQTYFTNTFPNLRNVCPALYPSTFNQPIPQTRSQNTTAASASDARLIGGPFDMTGLATFIGISREWATGGIWALFWLCLDAAIVWKLKATRIALYVFGFAMIGGAITGFMGMLVGVLVGLLGSIAIVFAFMWKGAT